MSASLIAGLLNFAAALMHLFVIWGGPAWYRFFGAGERMANMAEDGRWYPALLTLGITGVLTVWGLYALQAGGYFELLPWTTPILWAITLVYSFRAVYPLVMSPFVPFFRTPFMIWSSLIVAVYAACHWLVILSMR